jgi:hypothetical protein
LHPTPRPAAQQVGKKWKALRPFPPGGVALALRKLLLVLLWLAWAALLSSLVLPVLLAEPRLSLLATLQQHLGGSPDLWRTLAQVVWCLPPLLHVVCVWGNALLCQRCGYTASLAQALHARYGACTSAEGTGLAAASAAAARAGAHASCAADPAIDALFFPAANLAMDRRRSWLNALLWAVVLLLKVAFDYFLVVYPVVSMGYQVRACVCVCVCVALLLRVSGTMHSKQQPHGVSRCSLRPAVCARRCGRVRPQGAAVR